MKRSEVERLATSRKAAPLSKTIVELMQAPAEQRDSDWLKHSLQAAIVLELSTLPPYLCALWSIKTQSGEVYDLIDSVVLEEMLHMGLACNMLTTIGGTPQISTSLPPYPGPLPGGVRPELTVYLAGLSKDYLKDVFMEIEYPENGPVALALGKMYPTIGAFYSAILDVFKDLSPQMTGEKQLTATIGDNDLYAIKTVADAEKAINEIKQQGEGTSRLPTAPDFGGELAHYYKYAEIWRGLKLVQKDGKWQYGDDPIPFPDVYPMSPIPKGGYPSPSIEAKNALQAFDKQYTKVLNNLQSAWANGSQGDLGQAVSAMRKLKSLAIALMQISLPDGSGVYGPDFLVT
jgi:hypothetical protein